LIPLINIIGSFKDAIKRLNHNGIALSKQEQGRPSVLYERLKNEKCTHQNEGAPPCQFIKKYNDVFKLVEALVKEVSVQIVLSAEVSVLTRVQDLQRYAGIDIGGLYAPSIDELRQFLLINIYFGAVDDKPRRFSSSQDFWVSRFSLSVGAEMGDLGGSDDAVIRDGKAYAIGVGFRLNKYFRLGVGSMLYRSVSHNDLRSAGYVVISMGLTGFRALEGLVSK